VNLAFVSLVFRRLYPKLPHSGLPGAKIALSHLFSFQTQVCAIGYFASIIPILLSALSAAHGGRPSRTISAVATAPTNALCDEQGFRHTPAQNGVFPDGLTRLSLIASRGNE